MPVQGDDPARRRNTAVRLRAPLAMPARSSISADPQGKGHAGLTLHQRGTAARYLAEITEWQRKHGGFRRAPPRQYSIRLNNWIQRARTNHLNGLLRDEVVKAMISLGVLHRRTFDGVVTNRIHEDVYARATSAVNLVIELGLEQLGGDLPSLPRGDQTTLVRKWVDEMRRLKCAGIAPLLLEDLSRMIPVTYRALIDPLPGTAAPQRQTNAAVYERCLVFAAERRRVPDIFGIEESERELASWLIQFEHGLLVPADDSNDSGSNASSALLNLSESLLERLRHEDAQVRRAQWRWWSQMAMQVLRAGFADYQWDTQLWQHSPDQHADRLGLNLQAAKAGKEAWQGGPVGVDVSCIRLAIERYRTGSFNAGSLLGVQPSQSASHAAGSPAAFELSRSA